MSFYVSAPGKAILFGEHSAVYGKPAIAAALSLRAYMLVEPADDAGQIELFFPDLDIFASWKVSELPWEKTRGLVAYDSAQRPLPPSDLVPEILLALEEPLRSCTPGLHYSACRCFLYMYMSMCSSETPARRFSIRSTLPIGAGLGSSAAVSVSLSAGMSLIGGHVTNPSSQTALTDSTKSSTSSNSSTGSSSDFIDSWAFIGEKCFHGNPSGIDNAVATYGGAVLYKRAQKAGVRQNLQQFPELSLLLTNTKVPRSTATLVGHVAEQHGQFPEISGAILDAMAHIVHDAHATMQAVPLDRARLRQLVSINHGLLAALGVSHPILEEVKIVADRAGVGATKLTGAGGGGCALTILEDGVADSKVEAVQKEFEDMGLETYCTALGGKGVGMLMPTPKTEQYFTSAAVAGLVTRHSIEAAIGPSSVPDWVYW